MSRSVTVTRYSVSVSAYDDCDCRKTYDSLYVLCRVPESRTEANAAADELVSLLAADGYTDVVSIRINTYSAVLA